MAKWFSKNWPVGAGIFLAAGMILIFSLLTPHGKAPDTGWNESLPVRHGLASQNPASRSLNKILILAKASVKHTATQWSRAIDAGHPFEIQFDGQTNQNPEFRYDTLPMRAIQAEPFIEPHDPRIDDLMSDLSGTQGSRILIIRY